jgi:hypothetical protein
VLSPHLYIDAGRAVAFLILLSFLITFALTRLYTRLARVRGWGSGSAGGIHLHHMVFGIVFVLLAGFVTLSVEPAQPWVDVLAILFGVGAALTLDEFALWLHLKDVYWQDEGRASVDAVIFAVLLGSLVVLGFTPFGVTTDGSDLTTAIWAGVDTLCALVALAKGKFLLGLAGVFIPFVALVAAIRLARPRSPWARRRYARNPQKLARAVAREEKRRRRKTRVRDLIGGAPTLGSPEA